MKEPHSVGPSRPLPQIHPRGLEPLTFGSVDRCSIVVKVTYTADNPQRQ